MPYEALDFSGSATPVADFSAQATQVKPNIGDHVSAFFRGLGTAPILHPIDAIAGTASAIRHPIDTASQILQSHEQTAGRAAQSFKNGDVVPGVIHAGLAAIPMVGPAIDNYYQQMKDAEAKGDTVGMTEAAGKMIGIGASEEAMRGLSKVAPTAGSVSGAAAKAGAGDISAGVAKAGAGYALSKVPIAGEIGGAILGARPVWEGVKQAGRGVKDAWTAGRKAYLDGKLSDATETNQAISRLKEAYDPDAAPRTDVNLSYPVPQKAQGPNVIPFSKPSQAPEVFEAKARAAKAQELAKWLHSGGISSDDAKAMTADHWNMAAKGAGVNAPSLNTQGQALFYLRQLEAQSHSPQLMQRLQKSGAMNAAEQLRQSMSQ